MGLLLGLCSFALFFLSDYNDWRMHRQEWKLCFPLGAALLLAGTLLRCGKAKVMSAGWVRMALFLGVLAFAALLIYTLFFAISLEVSYARPGEKRRVCTTGVYALCRHPGVLWFMGAYACLPGAAGLPVLDSVLYSGLNVLLVCFEDRWVFPELMEGYGDYQAATPFLVPNGRSIRACFKKKV